MSEEIITLVDDNDEAIGGGEKMRVHRGNLLHRAFSILVFDPDERLILQKRASGKYHSAGLWTNTCCGHPRFGEETAAAAKRRLAEEMGFTCALTEVGIFRYQTDLDNGIHENEIDHVFCGVSGGPVHPDRDEVEDVAYAGIAEILTDVRVHEERYTYWFAEILKDDALMASIRRFLGRNGTDRSNPQTDLDKSVGSSYSRTGDS